MPKVFPSLWGAPGEMGLSFPDTCRPRRKQRPGPRKLGNGLFQESAPSAPSPRVTSGGGVDGGQPTLPLITRSFTKSGCTKALQTLGLGPAMLHSVSTVADTQSPTCSSGHPAFLQKSREPSACSRGCREVHPTVQPLWT